MWRSMPGKIVELSVAKDALLLGLCEFAPVVHILRWYKLKLAL